MENQQGPAGQHRELCSILCNNLMVTRGKDGEGILRESGMDMDTLLYLTWRTSKDLLSGTGSSAQCRVAAWMGGELGEKGCMGAYSCPYAGHLKPSQHCSLAMLSHFSRVRLCVTPWTAAYQAPLSLGFSRQEHWSGVPLPSPVHWLYPSIKLNVYIKKAVSIPVLLRLC